MLFFSNKQNSSTADTQPSPHTKRPFHELIDNATNGVPTRRTQSAPKFRLVDSLADLRTPLTNSQHVRHVLQEVVLLAKLAWNLFTFLGVGWKWSVSLFRLVCYAVLLLPGFLQMIAFYYFSKRVVRGIPYGRKPRNYLDMYIPYRQQLEMGPVPVVIFITGGAWIIGYKAWGALIGRRLSQQGVLVASLDYRNFPQGKCPEMLEDVNTGVSWVLRHAVQYGGDLDRVYICGQSAGGHLAALAILKQVENIGNGQRVHVGGYPIWSPCDIKGFIGVSSPYNMEGLAQHFDDRGLYRHMFDQIMSVDGIPSLKYLSPIHTLKGKYNMQNSVPKFTLLHGTADKTVPYSEALNFEEALKAAGVEAKSVLYEGKTHTQPIVEDPMKGGIDPVLSDILQIVKGERQKQESRMLIPAFWCYLAGLVCPF